MSTEQLASSDVNPMEFWLDQSFDLIVPNPGDTVVGTVIAHQDNEILVDIGAKSEGIILNREVEGMDDQTLALLAVGEKVSVYVVSLEDERQSQIVLSYGLAIAEQGWELAAELLASEETYACKIIGYNKGGLLTKIKNVRAFIPSSQLGGPPSLGLSTAEFLEQFVDQTLEARVIEVDRSRNRLILSARAAAKKLRDKNRANLLSELNEGDVVPGKIVNLERFGAFVDIGGLQGLVHLSELSWKRISHPADIVNIGDELDVYILSIDHEKQRVALSLKRLSEDPWQIIDREYAVGQLVEVTITKLERYGAFARLNDAYELEGLIHISELAHERVQKPAEVVAQGDVTMVRIIRIDAEQRQLGLSLKQVSSEKYMSLDLAQAESAVASVEEVPSTEPVEPVVEMEELVAEEEPVMEMAGLDVEVEEAGVG